MPVGPGDQAFRKVHINPLRRIRRINADDEISDEVAALGQRDCFDRRRLGKLPVVLGQRINRLRERVLRPLDRFLLRPAAGDAAGKIGEPRAERPLGTALQNCRKEASFHRASLDFYAISHTSMCQITHRPGFRQNR